MVPAKISKDFLINTSRVAFDGKMSVANIMTLFQEIVFDHTEMMELGMDRVLRDFNLKWVIVRIRFEIKKTPVVGDTVTVSTWPLSPAGIRFTRCFDLKDKNGETLITAISDWCLINADTGKVQRVTSVPSLITEYEPKGIETGEYSNLKMVPDPITDKMYEKRVLMSDIDMNRHVNNISYIKMALDCFSLEEFEKTDMTSFEMYYTTQCYEGDNVLVYRCDADGGYYIQADNSDGKVIFRCTVNK